jgi:PTS system nitrogen regulatory IIA component
MKNVLTIDDVAKKLQMSTSTIYKYAEKGKIPSFKIGSCRRFTEEHLESFLSFCEINIKPKRQELNFENEQREAK